MANGYQKELLSSLVSDIKNYSGTDPLRPWIQGMRKMKESLPPQILKEKLPRFLQKCVQAFELDPRYRNDSRYLRVWIQLMDYVDDARVLLRKMEKNHIGSKKAMFYSAYALYYEKRKKFDDAERMYHFGVQNLAEPADELQKSYSQFLHRMKLMKQRKSKKTMSHNGRSHTVPIQQGEASDISCSVSKDLDKNVESALTKGHPKFLEGVYKSSANSLDTKQSTTSANPKETKKFIEQEGNVNTHLYKPNPFSGDDTVVVKFVGSAIVGKSEAEDACHHGLVDPTVNMKEAMNAISNMFREPLEAEPIARRRSNQIKPKVGKESSAFEVYVEESSEERMHNHHRKVSNPNSPKELQKPFVGAFKIWTDDDDNDEYGDANKENNNDSKCSGGDGVHNIVRSEVVRLKEDTIIRRFMGSTALGESEVENACHHGLVDPTINMKEAMDDINSMFGKPLNFVRATKPKKQAKPFEPKPVSQGFCILADDKSDEDSRGQVPKSVSSNVRGENDLFEPTIFTKEAMADINELFGKPLDF